MDSIVLAVAVVKGHSYAVLIEPVGNVARVSSKSDPARTHRITADGCDCTYARYHADRGCAHLLALAQVRQARRPQAARAS